MNNLTLTTNATTTMTTVQTPLQQRVEETQTHPQSPIIDRFASSVLERSSLPTNSLATTPLSERTISHQRGTGLFFTGPLLRFFTGLGIGEEQVTPIINPQNVRNEFQRALDNIKDLLEIEPFTTEGFARIIAAVNDVLNRDEDQKNRNRAYVIKAAAQYKMKQFSEAVQSANQVPTHSTYYDAAQAMTALAQYYLKDLDKAITAARKVQNGNRCYGLSQIVKASAHMCKEEFDLAYVTSENVPLNDLYAENAQIIKAEVICELNLFDEAISAVDRIREQSRNFPYAQLAKANVLLKKLIDPLPISFFSALVQLLAKKYPLLLKINEAVHRVPRNSEYYPYALLTKARAHFQFREFEDAIRCAGLIPSDHECSSHAKVLMAQAYYYQNKFDDVISLVKDVENDNPAYFGAQFLMGRAYLKKGESAKALECLSMAAEQIPIGHRDYWDVQVVMAYAYLGIGKSANAISTAERILSNDNKFHQVAEEIITFAGKSENHMLQAISQL